MHEEERKELSRIEKNLQTELATERELRLKQIEALEELHVEEFKQLENEHSKFVTYLSDLFQGEVDTLKAEVASLKAQLIPQALAEGEFFSADTSSSTLDSPPEAQTGSSDKKCAPDVKGAQVEKVAFQEKTIVPKIKEISENIIARDHIKSVSKDNALIDTSNKVGPIDNSSNNI